MYRTLTAIASALILCASVVPSFAQSEDDQPAESVTVEAPAPQPLNVTPAGIARQDWEIVRDVVLTVPSPAGDVLTGSVTGGFAPYQVAATLNLDGQFQQFYYDCQSGGRCRGFATDIWRSIPKDQRQAYADSIVDALMAAFPIDRGTYSVGIGGRDAKGYQVGILVQQLSDGRRIHEFIGEPPPAVRPTGSTGQP